jgi:TolB-like protein
VAESDDRPNDGLWARLRRRKVVQWGIAYVAAGWGLLQGLQYVSSTFHWPEQLQRLAVVAFVVGLPIALVVAWYHGDRGQQKIRGTEFALLTVLLLTGGTLFWWVGRMPDTPAAGGIPAAAPAAAAAAVPSIAVLPFVNMSDDPGNEYFSDGISEELLNVLAQVDGLGVASRTSSFAYKGSELGAAAIANALKVDHVLEGSVRKSGNHVRITAQLIDAANDRHLWSETYDRELTDIFAIQEEIANSIVSALRQHLGSGKVQASVTVRQDTANVEAYELYLQARELFIARRNLPEAVRLFEQVTRMDPNFGRGWEGLAAVCAIIESWGIHDRDYTALAILAANRALELDPSLSMPWAALGISLWKKWPVDWARSLELLERAITADPRNATAYLWRSLSWLELGLFDRALADLDRCLELEPIYPNAERHKALALLYAGRTDAALALFERGVAMGFVNSRAESFVGPLLDRGNTLAAELLLDDMGFSPEVRSIIVASLKHPGEPRPDAVAAVERYLAESDVENLQSLGRSHPYVWLGAFDRVGDLDEGVTTPIIAWERFPPAWRNSPGFKRRLERNGVLAYWRSHGFPPQCRAVGARDFTCD